MIAGLQAKSDLMTGAKQSFQQRCAVCHGKNGEGNIGPNLTDDYWLHGGRLTQIYTTISEGVPAKGMLTWKNTLGPAEMLGLAAYVGTLHGTNPPNPKPPQGDKYLPEATPAASTPTAAAPTASGTAARGK
jgi:cytochrome c oxidase cbb3-type subunit 3